MVIINRYTSFYKLEFPQNPAEFRKKRPSHNPSQAGETYLQYSVVGWCAPRTFVAPPQNEKQECSPSWGRGQSGVEKVHSFSFHLTEKKQKVKTVEYNPATKVVGTVPDNSVCHELYCRLSFALGIAAYSPECNEDLKRKARPLVGNAHKEILNAKCLMLNAQEIIKEMLRFTHHDNTAKI
jgi:hypothetical protein